MHSSGIVSLEARLENAENHHENANSTKAVQVPSGIVVEESKSAKPRVSNMWEPPVVDRTTSAPAPVKRKESHSSEVKNKRKRVDTRAYAPFGTPTDKQAATEPGKEGTSATNALTTRCPENDEGPTPPPYPPTTSLHSLYDYPFDNNVSGGTLLDIRRFKLEAIMSYIIFNLPVSEHRKQFAKLRDAIIREKRGISMDYTSVDPRDPFYLDPDDSASRGTEAGEHTNSDNIHLPSTLGSLPVQFDPPRGEYPCNTQGDQQEQAEDPGSSFNASDREEITNLSDMDTDFSSTGM